MNRQHDDPLASHLGIEKTWELIVWIYYWQMLRANVEFSVREYNVCLVSKSVRYKPYGDFQAFPMPTDWEKELCIDFFTEISVFTYEKRKIYNSIIVIINWLREIVFYGLVIVIIDAATLAEVILKTVMWHHCLWDPIVYG